MPLGTAPAAAAAAAAPVADRLRCCASLTGFAASMTVAGLSSTASILPASTNLSCKQAKREQRKVLSSCQLWVPAAWMQHYCLKQ